MADVWYYARDGQQAGPVSATQLQQLARSGQIRTGDLVWREGLPQWVPARSVTGLFAAHEPIPTAIPVERDDVRDDPDDDRPRRRPRESAYDLDDDRPRRRRADRYDDEDDFEDRPRRRRRRAAGGWAGLSSGARAGIVVGALVLVALAVAVPVLIFTLGRGPDDGDRTFSGRLTWTDRNDRLRPGCRAQVFHYRMRAGTTYTIRMLSNQFDSYLRLEDPAGNPLAEDDDGDGFPNARIVFTARQDGSHRLVATSFAPNTGGNFQIVVTRTPPPERR